MTRAATYSNPENTSTTTKRYSSTSTSEKIATTLPTKISTGTAAIAVDEIRQSRDSVGDGKWKDQATQCMAPKITPAAKVMLSAMNISLFSGFPE